MLDMACHNVFACRQSCAGVVPSDTYPASFLNLALKVEYQAFRDAYVRDFRMMR